MHCMRAFDAMPNERYGRCMSRPDLNLLFTLEVLLAEGSVAGAAKRLGLSPSAMSRAVARLRKTTGDPLMVRIGRELVPTPRALELRERVGQLVREAELVLGPAEALDLATLERTFTLRTGDGFVENFGPRLIEAIRSEAPGVRLRFMQKSGEDSEALHTGIVDLETGVVRENANPELRTQALFVDSFVGVVRMGHPLSQREITPSSYAAGLHVDVSRHVPLPEAETGPIDGALNSAGFERTVSIAVGGFSSALALARASDLIATVPRRHTKALREDMFCFELPFSLPDIRVSMLWHPRLHEDQAHRWLRGQVRAACAE